MTLQALRDREQPRDVATVDHDLVARLHVLPDLRRPAVDQHATLADPVFDLAARAQPVLGEQFVQPLVHARGRGRGAGVSVLAYRADRRRGSAPAARRRAASDSSSSPDWLVVVERIVDRRRQGRGFRDGRFGDDDRFGRQFARQVQLVGDVVEVLQLGERRQVVEALEPEVVEELARRAEQFRLARHFAMADDADPVALVQRAHDRRD